MPTKFQRIKAMVFPVVMCACESWTIKKAECEELMLLNCWRRLLRAPWTARRSNEFILKTNQSWIFFGRMDAEAATPILGHLMWRTDSFEKTLMLGKVEGERRRGQQWMRWLDFITEAIDMSLNRLWVLVMDREAWRAAFHRLTESQTRLYNWTELNWMNYKACP